MRRDGLPVWTSAAMPGHLHDLTCAQTLGVTAALNWAASELDLPALADSGYEGAGHGIKTPTKQPAEGKHLAVANRTVNRLLRGLRWQGGRGASLSRSLIGSSRRIASAFVTPRYASRSHTRGHHLAVVTGCARTHSNGSRSMTV
jgi:hypothetical protein